MFSFLLTVFIIGFLYWAWTKLRLAPEPVVVEPSKYEAAPLHRRDHHHAAPK